MMLPPPLHEVTLTMSGRFVNPSIVWLSTPVISLPLSLFLRKQSMIVMPTVARAELPAANVLLVWLTIILSADRTHSISSWTATIFIIIMPYNRLHKSSGNKDRLVKSLEIIFIYYVVFNLKQFQIVQIQHAAIHHTESPRYLPCAKLSISEPVRVNCYRTP